MSESLSCYHVLKSVVAANERPAFLTCGETLQWSTCLREIVFLPPQALPPAGPDGRGEILTDEEAYRFCLQVICGLRSSLLGETEVLGQFKNFVESVKGQTPFEQRFLAFAQSLLKDAKKVRSEHLTDFGAQSYGRLAREWSQGCEQIHMIGYGQLAQQMEPWFAKSKIPLVIHMRNPRGRAVSLRTTGQNLTGALVLAAPISDASVMAWLGQNHCRLETLIDFRETSRRDSFCGIFKKIFILQDAFALIETGRDRRLAKVALAERAINDLVQHHFAAKVIRPYGWDDLCA